MVGRAICKTARNWVKLREWNEALDLKVYTLAALYVLGQPFVRGLEEREARFARPVAASVGTPAAPRHAPSAVAADAQQGRGLD